IIIWCVALALLFIWLFGIIFLWKKRNTHLDDSTWERISLVTAFPLYAIYLLAKDYIITPVQKKISIEKALKAGNYQTYLQLRGPAIRADHLREILQAMNENERKRLNDKIAEMEADLISRKTRFELMSKFQEDILQFELDGIRQDASRRSEENLAFVEVLEKHIISIDQSDLPDDKKEDMLRYVMDRYRISEKIDEEISE
ncbi:MAG: hypothetical protein HQK58_11285, partial [Deltaproteobacteria bacterium]|nr:hypothetical protein [Deltaproteobacteria bacterium]